MQKVRWASDYPQQHQWDRLPRVRRQEEWPTVVRRVVENQESLRKVAEDYGVLHETIRRAIRASHKRKH